MAPLQRPRAPARLPPMVIYRNISIGWAGLGRAGGGGGMLTPTPTDSNTNFLLTYWLTDVSEPGVSGRGTRAPSDALVGRIRMISWSVEAESPPTLAAPAYTGLQPARVGLQAGCTESQAGLHGIARSCRRCAGGT